MGLAVVARIDPYDHARTPSHREIIVHAKASSASSLATKPPASLLRTLPPDKSVANGISSKVTASSSACKQSAGPRRTDRARRPRVFRATGMTAYLEAGGTLENAQAMAEHESPCTAKLYDRTGDEITLDEVERITI